MTIRLATEKDKVTWDAFVNSSQFGSFLQSWVWGDFQRASGVTLWRLVAEENSKVAAVALILKRSLPYGLSWLYVPRGPVLSPTSTETWKLVSDKLIELAKQESTLFIRIDPSWLSDTISILADRWQKADREVQPRQTIVLDISQPAESLLGQMHSKTRYNIRLAEKHGITVQFSTDSKDLDHFWRLAQEVQERSGFHYHPKAYYQKMLHVLGPASMLEVATAAYKGEVIAAMIVIYSGTMATYAHGASTQRLKEVMAPYVLHWETIKRAHERGIQRYDLYGVAPEGAPSSHSWAGISRFKRGFGGKYEEYVGAYDYVAQPMWYAAYQMAHHFKARRR